MFEVGSKLVPLSMADKNKISVMDRTKCEGWLQDTCNVKLFARTMNVSNHVQPLTGRFKFTAFSLASC